jgi:hypothetical protein
LSIPLLSFNYSLILLNILKSFYTRKAFFNSFQTPVWFKD